MRVEKDLFRIKLNQAPAMDRRPLMGGSAEFADSNGCEKGLLSIFFGGWCEAKKSGKKKSEKLSTPWERPAINGSKATWTVADAKS